MEYLNRIDWDNVVMQPMVGSEHVPEGYAPAEIVGGETPNKAKFIIGIKVAHSVFRLVCIVLAVFVLMTFVNISKDIQNGVIEPMWDIVQINALMTLFVGLFVALVLLRGKVRL